MNCATPGPRQRTDQLPSDKRPVSFPRPTPGRRLSENQKARISVYLQVWEAMMAALFATFCAAKNNSTILFESIRVQGLSDLLYLIAAVIITGMMVSASLALYGIVLFHQSLVSIFSPFLLVNATFFTVQSSSAPSRSLPQQTPKPAQSGLTEEPTPVPTTEKAPVTNLRPLIDLSAKSSEAGDTPPAPAVLLPQVLSPTQLQLRSLSPAFDASIQQAKEREIEEIMQPSSRQEMPSALGAILAKRSDFGPLMYGRPSNVERSMSTVSYPDTYGDSTGSDEEADAEYKLMRDTIYESEQEMEEKESPVNAAHLDTDPDFDDEEDGDDMQFPVPDVQAEDIPYTSSPTHAGLDLGPEVIEVLDESRRTTMDAGAPAAMVMPVPHAVTSITPPPSRVTTMIQQPTTDAVDSPRDIFSPVPVSFPQPASGLPFAFPFLREQLEQRLATPPATSISQWSHAVTESDEKKAEKDENITEPTPYPSPPFTPPSSRPPTMYNSMALQIPPRDPAPEALTTPDPFVIDRSPLSALAEEDKPEPTPAVVQSVTEPEPESAPVEAEPSCEVAPPTVEAEEVTTDIFSQIVMSPVRQGSLRSPLSYVQQEIVSPPRAASPLKSIGRGGLLNDSRIPVDDFPADTSVVSTAEPERTLVASAAEEPAQEVSAVEKDMEYTGAEEPHPIRQASDVASGADDESTAPKAKSDKKKKKKTKKNRKSVSIDEVPFVIGSDAEREEDASDSVASGFASPALASPSYVSSPLAAAPIPIPRTFEIEEEVPELVSPDVSADYMSSSPGPMRPLSLMSELMSPRSTADELSDSSVILPPGQFSDKQVDHYGRWFARAHRDKALPSIQALRDQMKACTDVELAGRLRLGSRADPTKLSKSLVGEDNMKGVGAQGSLPPPPVRKGSSYRRRR
ncbi:hypothetical protein M408DRAFT_332451 [Serendipita vermifera MAFF 305830]|uniref:Uncharacterized protein n=1 Tax=Serendipita vermifera MAFF 305830 TaxID=933852 RepID=A0A0C3AF33_SERVB|nr:hypothetical protein M408DRAFT_332451 [Serendipita vermifera MAFF 305830]